MIDTRDKRSSAIHVSLPWRGMMPTPSGSISAADRAQLAYMYAGIASGPFSIVPRVIHHLMRNFS